MSRTIQPRAVRLDCIEEQNNLGAIGARVRNYRNRITRFVRHPIPSPTDHDGNARNLDIPRSDRGRVLHVAPNRDDNAAVRVLPPILLYEASMCPTSCAPCSSDADHPEVGAHRVVLFNA